VCQVLDPTGVAVAGNVFGGGHGGLR
jgi:hypothetical protein